jgi:glycosyltransferase involved in cell wall biosynthesis
MKRISVIGTVGLPANYGGFETLAEHLVLQLGEDYDWTVYCSGKQYPKEARKAEYKGVKLRYLPLSANGVQSILYDALSILLAMWRSDVLLVLGVSGAWIFPFVRLFSRTRIIVSIDGLEWKRDKWNDGAKWYLWWAEKMAVRFSHGDISDNESIQDYTAQRYNRLSRVLEYGSDHCQKIPMSKENLSKFPFLARPYAFKVARIEPENNVHLILKAFAELQSYPLVVIGNWQNSKYGQDLYKSYSQQRNIHLLDPIYDQQSLDEIRSNAHLYIHGHSAGGTNPSLVEAMYLGLPIFAFDVPYNRTTTEEQAWYFSSMNDLKKLLKRGKMSSLLQIGQDMQAIAQRRYTWKAIARKYDHLIRDAIEGRSRSLIKEPWSQLSQSRLEDLNIQHVQFGRNFYE